MDTRFPRAIPVRRTWIHSRYAYSERIRRYMGLQHRYPNLGLGLPSSQRYIHRHGYLLHLAIKPTARCKHGHVIVDDQLIIYGGYVFTENLNLADLWSLNLNELNKSQTSSQTSGQTFGQSSSQQKSNSVNVAAIVVPIVVTVILILAIFIFLKKRKSQTKVKPEISEEISMEPVISETPKLPESEIMQGVTVEFLIGSGNFGMKIHRNFTEISR